MKIRRPFRAVVYVAVIVAAVGYVVFSAWRLPAYIDSPVESATAPLFGRDHDMLAGIELWDVLASRIDGQWNIRRFSSDWLASPALAETVYVRRKVNFSQRGVWHAVVEVRTDEVMFTLGGYREPFTSEKDRVDILRALNAKEGYTVTSDEEIDEYASGPIVKYTILWLGVLGDLCILLAFAAIIFSLVKLRREIRWRKPGHCTECDYNLTGLTTDKCPECGAAVILQSSTKVHDP